MTPAPIRPPARPRRPWRARLILAALALPALGLLIASLIPVYAATATKTAKQLSTSAPSSPQQRIFLGGIYPSLSGSSTADGTTVTKIFDGFSYAPYSTTTTLAIFSISGNNGYTTFNPGERATTSITNPSGGLSMSDWAWYDSSGRRIHSVGGPSLARRGGPPPQVNITEWFAMNVTIGNPARPRDVQNGVFVGALPRPVLSLAYLDWMVSAVPTGLTLPEFIRVQQVLSQQATRHVNPRSQGPMAPPWPQTRACNHPRGTGRWVDLLPGRACAGLERLTDPVEAIYIGDGDPMDPSLIPSPRVPVIVFLTRSNIVPGSINGQPTLPTIYTRSAHRRIWKVDLPPGSALSFTVRIHAGVFHMDPLILKTLILVRMRELVSSSSEVTDALFSGIVEQQGFVEIVRVSSGGRRSLSGASVRSLHSSTEPLDRQEWAQLLRLYNRSLRTFQGTDPRLSAGRF